jgi:hypothetical protein
MDQLIEHINANNGGSDGPLAGVHIRYSTPTAYFDAVRAEARGERGHAAAFYGGVPPPPPDGENAGGVIPFPVYTPPRGPADGGVDFYPYADNRESWWTGESGGASAGAGGRLRAPCSTATGAPPPP